MPMCPWQGEWLEFPADSPPLAHVSRAFRAPYAYDYALFFGACATMLKNFRGLFSRDLSIDLGTANTLIYIREQGIVLDEPSVVALRQQGNQRSVAALGLGNVCCRTPGNITAIRPKRWMIADFWSEKMLTYFIAGAENSFIRLMQC